MKKITGLLIASLFTFVLFSCNPTMKGAKIANEQEWKNGFKILTDPRSAATSNSQDRLVFKDDAEEEELTATKGFKSSAIATAVIEISINGTKCKSASEVIEAIKNCFDSLKTQGKITEEQYNQYMVTFTNTETISQYFSLNLFNFSAKINNIATPNWEVQYTATGKDEDVTETKDDQGTVTSRSYTPAAMVTYYKGNNSWWANKTEWNDSNKKDPKWGNWTANGANSEDQQRSMYETFLDTFNALKNSFNNAAEGSDGRYDVTLYLTNGQIATEKSQDSQEFVVGVWFGEEDKQVKKIDGGASFTMPEVDLLGMADQSMKDLLVLKMKAEIHLDMDIEYPTELKYSVPKLLDEMKQ